MAGKHQIDRPARECSPRSRVVPDRTSGARSEGIAARWREGSCCVAWTVNPCEVPILCNTRARYSRIPARRVAMSTVASPDSPLFRKAGPSFHSLVKWHNCCRTEEFVGEWPHMKSIRLWCRSLPLARTRGCPSSGGGGAGDSTPAFAVATTAANFGVVGNAYTSTLAATGGTAPLTWTVFGGVLPAGLSLDPATGVVTGNRRHPPGNSTVTFTVTDSTGRTRPVQCCLPSIRERIACRSIAAVRQEMAPVRLLPSAVTGAS